MTLDDFAHDIRNGLQGIKLAVRHCERECPQLFHSVEVRQTIAHNVKRIERALKVYVSSQDSRRSQPASDTG